MIRLFCLLLLALSISPAFAQPRDAASLEKDVLKLHALATTGTCIEGRYSPPPPYELQSWTLTYRFNDEETGTGEDILLFRLLCSDGEENRQYAYYWYRNIEGLQPLAFAIPTFRAQYETSWDVESDLIDLDVTGMTATTLLFNSEFDPETETISSRSNWTGKPDTGLSGVWAFERGQFTLVRYDIDVSHDGEVNPQTVVDYQSTH